MPTPTGADLVDDEALIDVADGRHVSQSCPTLDHHDLTWSEVPLGRELCPVCGPLALFSYFTYETAEGAGRAARYRLERMAALLGDLNRSGRETTNLAIAVECVHADLAYSPAAATDDHFQLIRQVRAELDARPEDILFEVCRRLLVSAAVTEPIPGGHSAAHRAFRWAVSHGVDPHVVFAHLGWPTVELVDWSNEIDRRVEAVISGPRQVVVVAAPPSPWFSDRATPIVALGLLSPGQAGRRAQAVPAQLVSVLHGWLGESRIGDAGPLRPGVDTAALATLAGIWEPGSDGPLGNAEIALDTVIAVSA